MKDHADGLIAMPRKLERPHPSQIFSEYRHCAGTRVVEAGQEIQQCGLARAGEAQKGDKFTGRDFQRYSVDRAYKRLAHLVVARELIGPNGHAVGVLRLVHAAIICGGSRLLA